MPPRLERRAAARAPMPPSLPSGLDEEAEDATLALARSIEQLAKSITRATNTLEPAAEFFAGAGERLDKLCHFLKTKGPWLLGITPGVLVAINAVSPNAAATLKAIIAAFSAATGGG